MHHQNIDTMYKAVEDSRGFDIVIIVSSSSDQAEFWQQRLNSSRGSAIGNETEVISLEEDWQGGAGQLLGTLYAWKKAQAQIDLNSILLNGGTIAMYHTAGKGTRMAPIPAAESNNKSAIKLPRLIQTSANKELLTVLEAVIFQTGTFAASRPGRLCVFWGDQVFIPSKPSEFSGAHHAEIFDIRSEIPSTENEWKKDWQSYGLIIPSENGEALQREKQSWSELQGIIDQATVKPDESGKTILGKSLGCFTVSSDLLSALLDEFSTELTAREGKFDTDPHLWMPLTSSRNEFTARGGDDAHWERINRFKNKFLSQSQGLKMFGDKDIGADTLWWDYGQVQLYHQNFLKALEDSFEGECLRQFYDLDEYWIKNSQSSDLEVENSIIVHSQTTGSVKNSVVLESRADNIDISDSVVICSVISQVRADNTLMYKCTHLTNTELAPSEVIADIFLPAEGRIRMKTGLDRDGKEDWNNVICQNSYCFEELAKLVAACPQIDTGNKSDDPP